MNKWQYDNLHRGISRERVNRALTYSGLERNRKPNRRPRGIDKWALKRLEPRRRAFDALDEKTKPGHTRPGSMQRNS